MDKDRATSTVVEVVGILLILAFLFVYVIVAHIFLV